MGDGLSGKLRPHNERKCLKECIVNIMIQPEIPPMRQDGFGAIRIGQTRVLLELVIRAFQDGSTAEAIVQRYPTTTLADIYGVIAYYLRHQEDIQKYLDEREKLAKGVFEEIGSQQGDLSELRGRLLQQRT
jgi:uncharacterized protein (DUF433 family)